MIKQSNKRSLAFSLFRSSGPFLWIMSITLYILGTQVSYITPLVLEQYSNDLDAGLIGMCLFTGNISSHRIDHLQFWKYCISLLLLPLITAVLFASSSLYLGIISARIKTQLTSAIYHKSLYLSASSRNFTSTGKLINHISSDIPAICRFLKVIPLACSLPFMV